MHAIIILYMYRDKKALFLLNLIIYRILRKWSPLLFWENGGTAKQNKKKKRNREREKWIAVQVDLTYIMDWVRLWEWEWQKAAPGGSSFYDYDFNLTTTTYTTASWLLQISLHWIILILTFFIICIMSW